MKKGVQLTMKCPIDGATLTMAERSGIEIDYCPACHGVWLDRGELNKMIERASREEYMRYPEEPMRRFDDSLEHHSENGQRQDRHEWERNDKKKRRGSFLGDIFDGFGGD